MKTNPITVEVVRNAINAYADEMATALCKSAYNMMIYEVRDFCCGLIDGEGRHRALRARRLRARRRHHHESWPRLRPAPQQRGDLRAVLSRWEGRCLCREPCPLGRYRRHAGRLRRGRDH